MKSRAGIKINVLSGGEVGKLAVWLTKHKGEFVASRPTCKAVAELATKELGFAVTEWNVAALRKGMAITWPKYIPPKPVPAVLPATNGAVASTVYTPRAIVASIDERKLLCHIAVALRDIAEEWGIDSPDAEKAGEIGERSLAAMAVAFGGAK